MLRALTFVVQQCKHNNITSSVFRVCRPRRCGKSVKKNSSKQKSFYFWPQAGERAAKEGGGGGREAPQQVAFTSMG